MAAVGDPRCEVLAESAVALGRASYPTTHARELVEDLASAVGAEADVVLAPDTVTVVDRTDGSVIVRRIGGPYRFDQIRDAQLVIAGMAARRTPQDRDLADLARIGRRPPAVPAWLRIVGYALAALGFAAYLQMTPESLLAAGVLGLAAGAVAEAGRGARMAILMPVAVSFGGSLAVGLAARALDLPDSARLGAVIAVILLPGAALTAAVVELVGGDMVSGASRFLFALMQLAGMAFAFLLGFSLSGVSQQSLTDFRVGGGPAESWIGVVVFAVGVMLYYCTPRGFWLPTLAVVVVAHGTSLLVQVAAPPALAAGVAAAVALVAAWLINAFHGRGPMAVALFLPAFWLLVPGSLAFVAIAGLLDQDARLAALTANLGLSLMSVALGIMVATLAFPYRRVALRPARRA